jgi:hypothetical protein
MKRDSTREKVFSTQSAGQGATKAPRAKYATVNVDREVLDYFRRMVLLTEGASYGLVGRLAGEALRVYADRMQEEYRETRKVSS